MTSADKIAIAGIAFSALFSFGSFLLTLYFVVFKMGRWMGGMEEFKKHVTQDISFIRKHLFPETGGAWRPMTELAAARDSGKKKSG